MAYGKAGSIVSLVKVALLSDLRGAVVGKEEERPVAFVPYADLDGHGEIMHEVALDGACSLENQGVNAVDGY